MPVGEEQGLGGAVLTRARLENIYAILSSQAPFSREQLLETVQRYPAATTEASQRGMMRSMAGQRGVVNLVLTRREQLIGYYFGHLRHPDDQKCPINEWDKHP